MEIDMDVTVAAAAAEPVSDPDLNQTTVALTGGVTAYVGWNRTVADVICNATGETAWLDALTIGCRDEAGNAVAIMLHTPLGDGSVSVSAIRMGLPLSREILKGVVDFARWKWGATSLTASLRVDDLAALKIYRRLRFLSVCHVMQSDGERIVMRLTFDRLPAIWFRPPVGRLH